MRRQFDPGAPELMDRPQPVSDELKRDLHNLRQLNRFFGSYRLVEQFVRQWIKPGRQYRIADLATGSGDIPRLIADYARSIGVTVEIEAVDQQSSTIEIARDLSRDYPKIRFINGDILEWQPTEACDIVLCTLALHHFSEENAVRLLRRCAELSRRYVLVSDLRRGWLATIGVYLLTAVIYREPMTQYDARASAARAFSFAEFGELARRAGWKDFWHQRFRWARQAVWVEL